IVQVLVVYKNLGDFSETVTLTLKATNTTSYQIGVQVIQIPPATLYATYFNFNTTGVRPARYGLSGNASIPIESLGNRQDGLLNTKNMIHLLPLGDIQQDGAVTITDAFENDTSHQASHSLSSRLFTRKPHRTHGDKFYHPGNPACARQPPALSDPRCGWSLFRVLVSCRSRDGQSGSEHLHRPDIRVQQHPGTFPKHRLYRYASDTLPRSSPGFESQLPSLGTRLIPQLLRNPVHVSQQFLGRQLRLW